MGRPVDRMEGMVLVTDYGALDWALNLIKMREQEKVDDDCGCTSCGCSIGDK